MRSGAYLRPSTSCMERKSFASPVMLRILNRRYCDLSGLPLVKTTIDATVKAPWMVEISKHSMRRGGAGSARALSSCRSA